MLKILCAKCKNAYLQEGEGLLTCPACEETFPEADKNLLSGIQFYNEGDIDKADDCLMKYIVKEGAEPRAIFYKALCDASRYTEETIALTDTYEKLIQSLGEIDDKWFVDYIATANDDVAKIEQAIAEIHIRKLADSDAEAIKKQVSIIIALQNDAAEYRKQLTALVDEYNTRAEAKITTKFSNCCFVNAVIATEVGNLKFDKIVESIASHTVFTGILSTEIKSLEIYYRCIVMFFSKNREKYDFLMSSAEKFSELAKILEEGNYTSIKGTTTIGDRLKSAAYDFFQESLKDEDEEEEQTETVVVHEPETLEIEAIPDEEKSEASEEAPAEEMVFEDIYSNADAEEDDEAVTEFEDISSSSEESATEETENASESHAEDEETQEETEDSSADEPVNSEEEIIEVEEIEIEDSAEEETEEVAEEEPEEVTEEEPEEEVAESTEESKGTVIFNKIETNGFFDEEDSSAEDISSTIAINIPEEKEEKEEEEKIKTPSTPKTPDFPKSKRRHKKSYGPIVAIILIIALIGGAVAIKVLPPKIRADKYAQATQLQQDKKYMEAAALYEELEDYEDSKTQASVCRFEYASSLEKDGKYAEAAEIYATLGEYSNSDEKVTYCTYQDALAKLDSGKYDEAKKIFESIREYKDSADQIKECTYQKALKKIESGDFVSAVSVLESLGKYKSSSQKILEAKLGYVKANMDPDNETTMTYVNDLVEAKYPDDIEYIRKDLLNPENSSKETTKAGESTTEATEEVTQAAAGSKKIKSYVNYSLTDKKTSLKEADSGKTIYFHVEIKDPELYGKKFKINYKTSLNYETPQSTITFSESSNTFELPYTGDSSRNYTVEFSLYDESGNTVASQTVTIK